MIDIVRDNPANPSGRSRRSGREAGRHRVAGRKPHRVGLVVYDGLATFELGVACDVFGGNPVDTDGVPWYRLALCGAGRAPVTVDVGFQMQPTFGLERLRRVDTIVVPPTDCVEEVPGQVFAELRRAHARGCRIISLCTGAFVLAEAGLLRRPAGDHPLVGVRRSGQKLSGDHRRPGGPLCRRG